MSFYDQVLRELVAAIGGALFVGNMLALLRRRADTQRAKDQPGRRRSGALSESGELVQAPVVRTLLFALLGLVMLIAGIAALVAG